MIGKKNPPGSTTLFSTLPISGTWIKYWKMTINDFSRVFSVYNVMNIKNNRQSKYHHDTLFENKQCLKNRTSHTFCFEAFVTRWGDNASVDRPYTLRWIKTSGYETSRSTRTGWLRRISQKSRSAHNGAQVSLSCKRYASPHWSFSPSYVTLRPNSRPLT